MSKRALLWIAFAVVHVVVAALGFVLPNQPMGDVYLVYEPWADATLGGEPARSRWGIVGITTAWVYPQLAIVPMVVAQGLEWIAGYPIAWALVVTALDAVAFAILVGRGVSRGRTVAAWFWLAAIAMLGPVWIYRLDGVTVPLAIMGCLWLMGRPWLGSMLLAVATWIKVWPAALIAAAFIALRRRWAVLGGALVVSALTIVAVVVAGGGAHLFGFVLGQTGRGLQLEAPVSSFYLWRAVAGIEGSFIYYDPDMLTFQVTGPRVDDVIALMTPLLVVAVAAVAVLGATQAWRGATFAALFPPLALALVTGLIAFNKVGSPQFLTWIVAPVVMGLVIDRRRWGTIAYLVLAVALLTQIVYPHAYGGLLMAEPFPAFVLTLRNLLIIVLFIWSVVRLARVSTRGARARRGDPVSA